MFENQKAKIKKHYEEHKASYVIIAGVVMTIGMPLYVKQSHKRKEIIREGEAAKKALKDMVDMSKDIHTIANIMTEDLEGRVESAKVIKMCIDQNRGFDHLPGIGVYIHPTEGLENVSTMDKYFGSKS